LATAHSKEVRILTKRSGFAKGWRRFFSLSAWLAI